MDGCVVIHVRYSRDNGENPTELKVPYDISWQNFELLLKLQFDCTEMTVKYLDEDSDYILVSSDEELQEAFSHASRSADVLELKVIDSAFTRPTRNMSVSDIDVEEAVALIDKVCENDGGNAAPGVTSSMDVASTEVEQADSSTVTNMVAAMAIAEDSGACAATTSRENSSMSSGDAHDDMEETGERIHSRCQIKEKRNAENKRRIGRQKLRRGESCYTRCAQEIGDYRRCHSQPDDGKRHQRHLTRDQESGETHSNDAPVSYNVLMEFLSKLKEDLRIEIVRDVTRKTVKQVLKGLDGAVIQTVQGSKCLPVKTAEDKDSAGEHSEHPSYIHDGIICDNCEKKVVGVRYKCGNCQDYDLCEACEALDGIHNPEHVFVKLRRPWVGIGRVDGVQVPLVRCLVYQPEQQESSTDGTAPVGDLPTHPRWERIKEKMAKMQEKLKRKEEKLLEKHKKKEEKLKRRLEHERAMPVKRERLDIPQLRRQGKFDAEFISDVTIPDGTRVQPETKLNKSWLLRNTGNTTWSDTTKLKLMWGNMGAAQSEVAVPHLEPFEEGIVTVELFAPPGEGKYQSHWKMHDAGMHFGHRVWCAVIVEPKEVLEPTTEDNLKVVEDGPVAEEKENVVEVPDQLTSESLSEDAVCPMIPLVAAINVSQDADEMPVDHMSADQEDAKISTCPMMPLAAAVNAPQVVNMAPAEELKEERSESDRVEEDLTTAAAVVAQLQRGQERTPPKPIKRDNAGGDLLSFELVDIENRALPELSQTATPNNTPSDLTPPKSPVAGGVTDRVMSNSSSVEMVSKIGEEDDMTSTEMMDYVQERMASLEFKRDEEFELESLASSTDDDDDSISSDGDFFIVPLPDCFHPDKPLTRSQMAEQISSWDENFNDAASRDLNPELSVDEMMKTSSAVETPTLSPVLSASLGAAAANDAASLEDTKGVAVTVATQAGEVSAAETQTQQTSAEASTLTEDTPPVVEIERSSSTEQSSQTEEEAADQTDDTTTTDDKEPAEQQQQQQAKAGEFANQLMSTAVTAATRAASQAYSTAKEVFFTWQAKQAEGKATYMPAKSDWKPPADDYVPPQSNWTPPPDTFTPPQSTWTPPVVDEPHSQENSPMQQLMDMGFCDRALNTQLLEMYGNDVQSVVQELLLRNDNDWATSRH